ncbi:hypothetical protein OUZ56_026549 [Daphnia magna]|uniref:Uncharacterized protein n=1 Tax=Daphnia magna TaxID=35525 RepID=A0ABQ9ZM57_9CRUS|nr:hypothetical protein OUZ56_026549 [Daphnia magna]
MKRRDRHHRAEIAWCRSIVADPTIAAESAQQRQTARLRPSTIYNKLVQLEFAKTWSEETWASVEIGTTIDGNSSAGLSVYHQHLHDTLLNIDEITRLHGSSERRMAGVPVMPADHIDSNAAADLDIGRKMTTD